MVQIITNSNWWGGGVWVYKYKGSVDYYADLPTSWMKIWDTYNVVNAFTKDEKEYPAWTNVAWTGTDWDPLWWSIDLSEYQKKLVEWDGIDIDQTTNEISVENTVIQWASKWATAIQPNDNISELNNDAWYIDKDVNNLTNYTKTSDLPDFTTYQLKSNMVTSLNSADNDHYPTAKAVKDAITSSWGWDVTWPSSSVDGHLAVFDWATGKIIKDWWAIPTPTTVVDNLNSTSATSALSANQGNVLKWITDTINWKIPSAATTSNQLADKQFVNDAINSVTAYYITKNAAGDQFATKAELDAATVFYSGWVVRTPTRNDYTIVLDDETHNDEVTRYIYNSGWEYQYTINESPLTQAQLDALNSWITSGKVSSYDSVVSTIAWYWNIVTHNASEFATAAQGWKADTALQPNDNISELNNDAWYITWVDWGDIGWTLSNQVDLQNALNAKANDSGVVHTTWAETIAWTKTFSTSPVVPDKTADATNTWTAIATEAQVYKKQDELVSWTNIKTINWESVLGSWNISISAPSYTAGNWIDITSYEIWLDGTYSAVESDMQWPAPSWFHVPLTTEWQAVYDIWTALGGWSSAWTNFWIALKLPFAGQRYGLSANVGDQGTSGYYWSSSHISTTLASNISFASSYILSHNSYGRAQCLSVRCFKNEPTVPTSSWTKLYWTSIESWWIFWSSADWLISLSSDWNTWITIADKNLWATTVWNSWDTLSEANCGKYYQRWNNYWFPRTWSVTTSSTKVDASNYWPWNYYSSSTFIMGNDDWSSVQNDNLWWWTSQWTWLSWNLIIWDNLYKIVTSTTAPSWAWNNIITLVVE